MRCDKVREQGSELHVVRNPVCVLCMRWVVVVVVMVVVAAVVVVVVAVLDCHGGGGVMAASKRVRVHTMVYTARELAGVAAPWSVDWAEDSGKGLVGPVFERCWGMRHS